MFCAAGTWRLDACIVVAGAEFCFVVGNAVAVVSLFGDVNNAVVRASYGTLEVAIVNRTAWVFTHVASPFGFLACHAVIAIEFLLCNLAVRFDALAVFVTGYCFNAICGHW